MSQLAHETLNTIAAALAVEDHALAIEGAEALRRYLKSGGGPPDWAAYPDARRFCSLQGIAGPLTPAPEPVTLSLPVTLPASFLGDVLTTAVEGGSNYWLAAQRVERNEDLTVTRIVKPCDGDAGTAHDAMPFDAAQFAPGFEPALDITPATILRGIERLGSAPEVHADLRGSILAAVAAGDAGNIDAGDADILLQLGYFGSVIYG